MEKASSSGLEGAHVKGQREKKERATHFLCFPISSDATVPTLAKSIAYFQSISTDASKQPPQRRLETTADGKLKVVRDYPGLSGRSNQDFQAHDPGSRDLLGDTTKSEQPDDSFKQSLQVLPSISNRAPGTYHLTLGVMDLSDETKMQKAKDLLQSLDMRQIFEDAMKGPPAGTKEARKRNKPKATQGTGGIGVEEGEESTTLEPESVERATLPPQMPKSLARSVSPPPHSSVKPALETTSPSPPLYISLTGLGAFPSGKKARVLWARPREQTCRQDQATRPAFNDSMRLYNFALHLNHIFRREGLITETRPLVLHATVSNMRYALQAKAGSTSQGKARTYGKKRWKDGLVDARPLLQVFNHFNGEPEMVENGQIQQASTIEHADDDGEGTGGAIETGRDEDVHYPRNEYLWATNVEIDRVAICKMGATKAEDGLWGEWYPPVSNKMIFA